MTLTPLGAQNQPAVPADRALDDAPMSLALVRFLLVPSGASRAAKAKAIAAIVFIFAAIYHKLLPGNPGNPDWIGFGCALDPSRWPLPKLCKDY